MFKKIKLFRKTIENLEAMNKELTENAFNYEKTINELVVDVNSYKIRNKQLEEENKKLRAKIKEQKTNEEPKKRGRKKKNV